MTPPARPDRTIAGIVFMCMAGSIFPLMNGLVQVLSKSYESEQIVWARVTGHFVFMLALFAPRFGFGILSTSRPVLQLGRSVVLLLSTLCFFTGVKYLPLAQATAINFTSPFMVVLLAWPFLGERIGAARLAAVAVGFVGVLVVVRPGTQLFHWASLLIIGSSFFYAVYQIFTRQVGSSDRPETSAIYSALVGTVLMLPLLPFIWRAPASLTDGLLLGSLGVIGGLGHYLVAKALASAPASVIAPFMYWQMIGSVVVGYLLSGHVPDAATWAGAAIIIAAGIFVGWFETRRPPVQPQTEQPRSGP
ncbi:MAG: DMT family transporter [Hyphomicrobiaceae bacterium]|jgi:drug/metabolite transporter (DMT)-like permease